MELKVAFDSRPTTDTRGVGRYTRCLLAALRDTAGAGEIVEGQDPRRCDVFHSPWLDGALLRSPVPMVVTLHDLSPLKRRGEFLRSGLRLKLRYLAVQRAARVIVPTRAVAEEAISALGLARRRVAVIPEAAAPAFQPRSVSAVASARERFRLPDQYLLWVGGLKAPEPRKRVVALARAARELPLVMVGQVGRWAHELPGVTLTGVVSDDDLAAIYTGAHALVFPSDDEGFGLPPVEALACGTPVVASDVPALREVLGDRATLVAVDDVKGLIAAAQAATRPAPAAPAWTWQQAAAATWSVYDEVKAEAEDQRRVAPVVPGRLGHSGIGSAAATPRDAA